jgi:hypothetical protein
LSRKVEFSEFVPDADPVDADPNYISAGQREVVRLDNASPRHQKHAVWKCVVAEKRKRGREQRRVISCSLFSLPPLVAF